MDKNEKRAAAAEFDAICAALDSRGWSYEKDKDTFSVAFTSNGTEMPLSIALKVNPELMTVSVYVIPPLETPEGKEEDFAVATALINDGIVHGNFDYDKKERRMIFRMSTSYRDSTLDNDVYFYLIGAAFSTVDSVAPTIKALCDGKLTVEQIITAIARGE